MSLVEVCKYLGKTEINYLLVESGPRLVGALLKEKLIDEFILFIAPKLMGKEKLNFARNTRYLIIMIKQITYMLRLNY